MSSTKENSYEFLGAVAAAPEFQILPSGHTKGTLLVRVKDYRGNDMDVPFELFGKPAEHCEKKNLRSGMAIRVAFELSAFKGYPKLKAWRVDVRTEQPAAPQQEQLLDVPQAEEKTPPPGTTTIDDDEIPF